MHLQAGSRSANVENAGRRLPEQMVLQHKRPTNWKARSHRNCHHQHQHPSIGTWVQIQFFLILMIMVDQSTSAALGREVGMEATKKLPSLSAQPAPHSLPNSIPQQFSVTFPLSNGPPALGPRHYFRTSIFLFTPTIPASLRN